MGLPIFTKTEDMPAVQLLPKYTYDDYVQWEGRWELIYGIPYAMAPLPIPKHQYLAGNIHYEFKAALKQCRTCKVYQPLDYKISSDTIIQPDMLIVCREIKKKFLDFAPVLVVEVTSPATEMKDRRTKYDIYRQQQIRYYLIISPEKETVEVYELENDEYVLRKKEHSFTYTFAIEDCEATIALTKYGKYLRSRCSKVLNRSGQNSPAILLLLIS